MTDIDWWWYYDMMIFVWWCHWPCSCKLMTWLWYEMIDQWWYYDTSILWHLIIIYEGKLQSMTPPCERRYDDLIIVILTIDGSDDLIDSDSIWRRKWKPNQYWLMMINEEENEKSNNANKAKANVMMYIMMTVKGQWWKWYEEVNDIDWRSRLIPIDNVKKMRRNSICNVMREKMIYDDWYYYQWRNDDN